jgi:hypothetical protein
MAERTNARLLKSREVQASVGSNPTPSARCLYYNIGAAQALFPMSGRPERECSLFEPGATATGGAWCTRESWVETIDATDSAPRQLLSRETLAPASDRVRSR